MRVVPFFVEATANKSLPTASGPPPRANEIRSGHRGRACGHFATRGHHFGIPGTRRAPPSLRSHFSRFPVKPATEVPGDRPVPPLDRPAEKTTQVRSPISRGAAKAWYMHILVLQATWVRWVACLRVHELQIMLTRSFISNFAFETFKLKVRQLMAPLTDS